jgi:hypothetical protein
VKRVPILISATERARWLAELAAAVDDAQVLLWRIGVLEGDNADAKKLYGRLEATRAEIESLRGIQDLARDAIDPNWMKLLRWEATRAIRAPRDLPADPRRPRTARGTVRGAAASNPTCRQTRD